jgi:hypothetical protein
MLDRKCPNCSNKIKCQIEGMTLIIICDICGWNVASSVLKYIDADKGVYVVSVDIDDLEKHLGLVHSANFLHLSITRFLWNKKRSKYFDLYLSAYDAKLKIDVMSTENINFTVAPPFLYSNGLKNCCELGVG